MKNFLEIVWQVIVVILIFAGFIGLIIGIIAPIDYAICTQKLNKMNIDGNWGVFSGCMVKTDDFGVIPLDQYVFVLTGK